MNIFVLCTGRCGSVTFSRACGHLTNYTSGHESRARLVGPERFDFPPDHVEVDNRLSWHLGALGARYSDGPVLYVHLRRDPDAVARSFLKRWNSAYRASMIRAFGHGIVKRVKDWPEERRLEVCRHYVDTVTANIETFLHGRSAMTMWLESAETDFPAFLDRINAKGDLEAALAEWSVKHNASKKPALSSS
ncbi:hypothetical protein ABN034_26750 [Actinopolymorpha sp. B11F2]